MSREESIKIVCVGDGTVGKTCMLISFANNSFPDDYVPTVFDNFNASLVHDNRHISLQMYDTAGVEDYDRIRPLSYPETDVFVIVYSVVDPTSLSNVKSKWIKEIREHANDAPVILCGTKIDLRDDHLILEELQERGERPIETEEGLQVARKIKAVGFFEVSAKTQQGLRDLFLHCVHPKHFVHHKSEKKKFRIINPNRKRNENEDEDEGEENDTSDDEEEDDDDDDDNNEKFARMIRRNMKKEMKERCRYVIHEMGDLDLPLQNKTLKLWKSLLFNSDINISEEVIKKKLSKLSLDVTEEKIFAILFHFTESNPYRLKIPRKEEVKDYFILMKHLGLLDQIHYLFTLIGEYCSSFRDYESLFKNFVVEYENEFVRSWFLDDDDEEEEEEGEEWDYSFDHVYSLFLFRRMKKFYQMEEEKKKPIFSNTTTTSGNAELAEQEKYLNDNNNNNKIMTSNKSVKYYLSKFQDFDDLFDFHPDFENKDMLDLSDGIFSDSSKSKEISNQLLRCFYMFQNNNNNHKSIINNLRLKTRDGCIFEVNKELLVWKSNFFYRLMHFGGQEFYDIQNSGEVLVEGIDGKGLQVFLECVYLGSPVLSYLKTLKRYIHKIRRLKEQEEVKKEEEEEVDNNNNEDDDDDEMLYYDEGKIIKITSVGDEGSGMVSFLISFSTNSFPENYVPTVFDNYDTTHTLNGIKYDISLVSTAGQEDYDEIRHMSYEDVDVVLCLFNVTNPTSLHNVEKKWVPEIESHCDDKPIIMVGTMCDKPHNLKMSQIEEIRQRTGCVDAILCSSKTMHNVNKVFDEAIMAFLRYQKKNKKMNEEQKPEKNEDDTDFETDPFYMMFEKQRNEEEEEEEGMVVVEEQKTVVISKSEKRNMYLKLLRKWMKVFCFMEKYQEFDVIIGKYFEENVDYTEMQGEDFPSIFMMIQEGMDYIQKIDDENETRLLIKFFEEVSYSFTDTMIWLIGLMEDDSQYLDIEREKLEKYKERSKVFMENQKLKKLVKIQNFENYQLKKYMKKVMGEESVKEFESMLRERKKEYLLKNFLDEEIGNDNNNIE